MNSPISITITAETVAWYAAIISTTMLLLRLIELYRDKVNVKLKCEKNMGIIGNPENIDYIMITVINNGKRPVTIGNVSFAMKNGKYGIFSDSLTNGSRELTEGKSTSYQIKQDSVNLNVVKYFFAIDKTGREFRGKLN